VVAVSFSYKPTVQESALCGYDIFAHEKLAGLRGALRRGPRGHMPGGETVPILVMSGCLCCRWSQWRCPGLMIVLQQ
jgi:hypothetical protein